MITFFKKIIPLGVAIPSLIRGHPVHAREAGGETLRWNLEVRDIFAHPHNFDYSWNSAFEIIRILIAGTTGLLSIAMVGVFAFKAMKLAKSGDNPSERQKAVQGIVYSLVAFALLGATSLFTGIFYSLIGPQ